MIKRKRNYKNATLWHNDDGEFGAACGWLLKCDNVSNRLSTDVFYGAIGVSGIHYKLVKAFGRKISDKNSHGYECWTLFGLLFEPMVN
jgi:hypothetical protein